MGGLIKEELREALVARIGNGAAGCGPGKHRFFVFDALFLASVSVRPAQAISGSV